MRKQKQPGAIDELVRDISAYVTWHRGVYGTAPARLVLFATQIELLGKKKKLNADGTYDGMPLAAHAG